MSWKSKSAKFVNDILAAYDIRLLRASDTWHHITQLGRQPEPRIVAAEPDRAEPYFRTYAGTSIGTMQQPFDFAVVMPTILRPTIVDAISSVFSQKFQGRVQLLVGVDSPVGDFDTIQRACGTVPPKHLVQVFYPGYSTSRRHGGLQYCWYGGGLRTALSYLANSRYVAYLDDDNWYADGHLSSMYEALQGNDWAYSLRWFVHPTSRRPICEDLWEAIGPRAEGTEVDPDGWVDPNCLAIDKIACEAVLRWWSIPLRNSATGGDADRNVFRVLRTEFQGRGTGQATVFYTLSESDQFRHPFRLDKIGVERYAMAGLAQVSKASS